VSGSLLGLILAHWTLTTRLRVAFLTGPPFMTVLINLPQRFQAVSGNTPFQAGIRLLPLLLSSPVATAVTGQLVSKANVPPFYLIVAGASLQLLGLGLASSVGIGSSSDRMMYGFEVIMGFSFGATLIMLIIYVPFVVARADMGELPLRGLSLTYG
jgi:hypothetical protein